MRLPLKPLVFSLLIGLVAGVPEATSEGNGIAVGPPKVFDTRSLQIMLEQLSAQLATVQTIDQTKLNQALTAIQGAQTKEVSRDFALLAGGSPTVATKEAPNASGDLVVSERTTTRDKMTPTVPTTTEAPAAIASPPALGLNAEDLLSDQVSLSYQVFNVRMLLEQALSDRLLGAEPRLRAVLGFQISLDPPHSARDNAAYVEVTLRNGSADANHPLALVAAMPYEKSYNSFALNTKSNAFGGSAVVKMISVGYTERHRGQTAYLFKDSDTLALTQMKPPAENGSITFGWEFRPVLGRRSVTAGVRQLFVVVALPVADSGEFEHDLTAAVKTYWREYRRDRLTTRNWRQAEQSHEFAPVSAYTSEYVEKRLAPEVDDVEWHLNQDGSANVSVTGKNFFPGTRVLVGSNVHDSPATGLVLKSERSAELRTSPSELAMGEAILSGRYGSNRAIWQRAVPGRSGILINQAKLRPEPGRDHLYLDVDLQDRQGQPLVLPASQPFITVGGTYVPGPYEMQTVPCQLRTAPPTYGTCTRFTAILPAALVEKDAVVTVRFPFLGESWTSSLVRYSPSFVSGVTVLGDDATTTRLMVRGRGFNDKWIVRLDKDYKADSVTEHLNTTSTALELKVSSTTLAKFKSLLVVPPDEKVPAYVVDLAPPPPPNASLAAKQTANTVKKDTGPTVVLTGEALGSIKKVSFEGTELAFQAGKGGTELVVFLTRKVTEKTGPVELALTTGDGTLIPGPIIVAP